MLTTKRKPATVGEILVEEFMQPMGSPRPHWRKRWVFSASMSMSCAIAAGPYGGDRADPRACIRQQSGLWLNVQRRSDLWEAMNSPSERERIERAKPLGAAA